MRVTSARDGRIEVVDELHLDERVQSLVCVLGRVAERFEKHVNQVLDFGVGDDFAEPLQTPVRGSPDLLVTVIQHTGQGRDDFGQAISQLVRVEVRHGAEKVAGASLASPLLIIKTLQQGRHDLLDTVRAQLAEACLRSRKTGVPNIAN